LPISCNPPSGITFNFCLLFDTIKPPKLSLNY
jgi:hypothetical protein